MDMSLAKQIGMFAGGAIAGTLIAGTLTRSAYLADMTPSQDQTLEANSKEATDRPRLPAGPMTLLLGLVGGGLLAAVGYGLLHRVPPAAAEATKEAAKQVVKQASVGQQLLLMGLFGGGVGIATGAVAASQRYRNASKHPA